MADLSSMSDAELEAIAGGGASAPAGDLSHMSDAELQKIAGGDGPLANKPDDGYASGAAKGAATAVIKGAANIPGLYGNLRDTGQYLADRAIGAAPGNSYDDVAKRQAEIGDKIKADRANDSGLGWLIGKLTDMTSPSHLYSGADIAAPALEKTGEYTPTSMPGRMAQAGLEGAISALGPGSGGSVGSAARIGPINSPGALATLKGIGATGREMAPAMLAGGAAAQGTTEITGDPLYGMIAGAAVPAAGAKAWDGAAGAAKKLVDPMRPSQQPRLADEQFYKLHSNPEKALADLSFQPQDLLPNPNNEARTPTAQITADAGALKATEQAQIHDDDFNARIKAMEGKQNLARRDAIDATQPNGDTMRPSDVLNQHLADLEAHTQAAVDRMTSARDQLTGLIPDAVPAETSGGQLRGALAKADEASSKQYDALYKAVDPDGKLALVTQPVKDAAVVISKSINPDVEIPSALAAEALSRASQFPAVMRFGDLMKFDKTLTNLMTQAKQTGDSGYGQLVQLKGVVKDAISRAVDNQHHYEQGQIARGERQPEDNVFNRLAADRERFYAERAGQNAGQAAVGDASAGSAGVSSMAGTQSQAGTGRGVSGGNRGVQGAQSAAEPLAPNLDASAAGRLSKANSAYGAHAQTYDEGIVGKLLDDNGYKGQYTTTDSAVPAQSFVKGDKGYETAQTMLGAAKGAPEAVSAMKDMAVTRLQEAMGDKPITEQTLTKWKQQHAGALRAVDEVSPGFSKQFDTAAKATTLVEEAGKARAEAIDAAKKGAAGKIMGAASEDEVRARVGKMLDSAEGGASDISELVQRVGHDPAALDGLRRAGVEHVMSKFSNMNTSGGEPIISGKMSAYLETHGDALRALYGEEGLANMRRTAASLDRDLVAKEALATTGSNSANKLSWLKGALEKGGHISLGTVLFMEGGEALMSGDFKKALGVAGVAAAKHLFSAMRAKGLGNINDLVKERLANPEVGRAALARAINAKSGKVRPSALTGLAKAIARANATGNSLEQPDDAPPLTIHHYADGGPVQADPDFMKHIIDAVAERVRASNPRAQGGLSQLRGMA